MKPKQPIVKIFEATLICVIFLAGAKVSYGADDLNLSDITPQPQGEHMEMDFKEYQDILDSFSKDVKDPQLSPLLERLRGQLANGDSGGAEKTRGEILRYIDENPESAPYGLRELLKNSSVNAKLGGKVDVDVKSLSESLQPGDLGEDSAEKAATMMKLADLLKKNPQLADRLMEMAQLINIGREEEARSIYQEINKDLLKALLQMEPELVSKAFDYLGEGLGEQGDITPPREQPRTTSPSGWTPSLSSLSSPIVGAPMPLNILPAVNLSSPYLFLSAIILPMLLLPLLTFRGRLQAYIPRVTTAVIGRFRPVESGPEPSEHRERIYYHFRRLTRVMGTRGVLKADYETHREFADRCSGRIESTPVKKASDLYELARFTPAEVSKSEADACAEIVDSVEKMTLEVQKLP